MVAQLKEISIINDQNNGSLLELFYKQAFRKTSRESPEDS